MKLFVTTKGIPSVIGLLTALTVSAADMANTTTTIKETLSLPESQKSVSLTIYNEDLALVKDQRVVTFNQGKNAIAWRGVSSFMRPETALLQNTKDKKSVTVIEQNFDFDLLTPSSLLEKYLGETLSVVKRDPVTGKERIEKAKVLSVTGGVVLQYEDNRIETNIDGRLVFPNVPSNLRDQPTLVIQLDYPKQEAQQLELSYLTTGLGWKADYVAELSADEKRLEMNGWVTLTNQSGATYNNAVLQLVAGDVNQVPVYQKSRHQKYEMYTAEVASSAPAMQEESLMDYHLYTLPHLTTIKDNQIKQVALMAANNVPTHKEYVLNRRTQHYWLQKEQTESIVKVPVVLVVKNSKPALGLPLPKGIVRVYKRDLNGNTQFIGEDSIAHSAEDETLRLSLGKAFDVTAKYKQNDVKNTIVKKVVQQGEGVTEVRTIETEHEITLANAKNEDVIVKLMESIPGEWTILSESQKHSKENGNTALWSVNVPAKGKTVLTYRVRAEFF